ncbi:hypothetical protein [Aquipseudomonas alcaligenes]|uniref:Uncharacterized protein n=1 Tax=Aquipseudomonas alcaligenes TaxID=43263 RepID=A0AA37FNE6_AQUAC|nr:hypothetical protein [Pseudomonas alcaligenes]BCR26239.1 hypothetical protein KAM426_37660 [Pseudomonas alcaligenes]GIZ68783.1 hypothetical protein KAM428_38680 [Pseudomonas alcaligenes]GIZ73167.1 hypothetical protein KAM429_39280 [Pseudomonas alcaligenes]GIZ77516.1 hypothetical protein KAM430_39250 [Pseudomonas alcaligenes]GIZ81825.1 hypothetical protein KAM432_38730 [Pseudomonas alcaligenes]
MSNDMKSRSQTHRDIAMVLGSDLGNAGFPMLLSFLAVGLTVKLFEDDMSGLLLAGLYIGGSLLLGILLMHFYVAFNGMRILKAVEKDYGPKTRQHVYNAFAAAKPGDKIDLDIPGVARAYREN